MKMFSSPATSAAVTMKELDALMNVIHNDGGLTKLTGTTSADTFIIDREFGQRTIKHFNAGSDKVDFSAYEDHVGNLSLDITQKGSDVVINLIPFKNGNVIIKDISVDDLDASNFNVSNDITLNVVNSDDAYWAVVAENWIEKTHTSSDRLDIHSVSGTGSDDMIYSPNNAHEDVDAGGGNNIMHTGDGDDWISGNSGTDIIFAGYGWNYIWGEGGHDIIYSGNGPDNLYGDNGNDYLHGGGGSDYLYGGHDDDTLDGGEGNDFLLGNGGDDRVRSLKFH